MVFCAWLAYQQYAKQVYVFNMNDVKLVADFLSIVLIHAAGLKLAEASSSTQNFLQKLYESSFFVYLSHCLILTLSTEVLRRIGISELSLILAIRFLVCYTIPFLVYFLYQKLLARSNRRVWILG